MKTKLRAAVKAVLAAGLMVLGLGMYQDVMAGTSDTMVVTVTPSGFNYAVKITSPEIQGYDFGSVGINSTTISTRAIGVQNKGNASEFFSVGIVDVTPVVGWSNSALGPSTTTYVLQALFVTTGAGQPANSAFAGATNNAPLTPPLTASGTFGQGATQTVPLVSKDLWLQLQMPTGVSDTGQHTLVLTVNGQSS